MEFTVATAIDFAQAGQIETWVHAYLTSGNWANLGLANGLRLQERWWIGPVSVELSELSRACGPEPWMEFQVLPEHWEQKIAGLVNEFIDLELFHLSLLNIVQEASVFEMATIVTKRCAARDG